MKNLLKILLLLVTPLPSLYFMSFSFLFGNSDLIFEYFDLLFKLNGIIMILFFALVAVYIILLFQNKRISEARRTQWILLLIFGNFIAMPFYWFIHLRPGIKDSNIQA